MFLRRNNHGYKCMPVKPCYMLTRMHRSFYLTSCGNFTSHHYELSSKHFCDTIYQNVLHMCANLIKLLWCLYGSTVATNSVYDVALLSILMVTMHFQSIDLYSTSW